MIDWKELDGLHAVKKLEKIIMRWFQVECLFTNTHYEIKSKHIEDGYNFTSNFLKVQLGLDFGKDILEQDIERITDELSSSENKSGVYDCFFGKLKCFAAKIEIKGEFIGLVVGFPFLLDTVTTKEIEDLKAKFIEGGAPKEDAENSVSKLKRLYARELNNLQELFELVVEEVIDFEEAKNKRDEIIHSMTEELSSKFRYQNIIGKSKSMQKIYGLLEKIKKSESNVIIQGENGTGKELVAKAIHYNSPRKDRIFLAVNCSALNDNLLDSELFGHVKGAFTGAVKDKKGLFETADGGTLFLDEVGDTSLSMQVKLLRVIQEGTFIPVGGNSPKKVNVRVICATNKNLKEMMTKGEFREDLFYRLNVINILLPALRERVGDIDILMEFFLKKRCEDTGSELKTFSKRVKEKILDYNWPGNVRELENEIERLVVLTGDDRIISPDSLSQRILDYGEKLVGGDLAFKTTGKLRPALEELEAFMIKEGLKRCNFNKSKLAKELGVSRASLIMKVEKYGLDKRNNAA